MDAVWPEVVNYIFDPAKAVSPLYFATRTPRRSRAFSPVIQDLTMLDEIPSTVDRMNEERNRKVVLTDAREG
jgi:hypothetical protein